MPVVKRVRVQWLPAESVPHKKSFTTFRHTTHLSLFGNTACETCHTINPKAEYAKFFSGKTGPWPNAIRNISKAISRRSRRLFACSAISRRVAGDSCLLCHRYHVGAAGASWPACATCSSHC